MSNLGYYVALLEDTRRIASFGRAIRATVRPGDHVVEVGCGVGTYSLMAARAGAARVTAIDRDPVALALAREIGIERLSGGTVRLVEAPAELVELEERADVVIFEDYGSLAFRDGYRRLLEHARTRLAKPGARWIPSEVHLVMAPLELAYRTLDPSNPGPLPFPPEAIALLRKRGLNDATWKQFGPERLAAPGQVVGRIRMGDPIPVRSLHEGTGRATRPADVTALAAWMRLLLAPGEMLDNSPAEPRASWTIGVYPFEEPLRVADGEPLQLSMEVAHGPWSDMLLLRWGLTGAGGRREGSSVNAVPGDPATLLRGSPASLPIPLAGAPVVAALLNLLDGSLSMAELADRMYASFKHRFTDREAAENFVFSVIERLRGVAVQ